jgi:putative SOS response-associated peptidase YedK
MIDRYTLTANAASLQSSFRWLKEIPEREATYNAAPTQQLPVTLVGNTDQIKNLQWGFMSNLANNKKMSPRLFNADINASLNKPNTRKSLNTKRCLIYADGFFVWKSVAKKTITPYYIFPVDHQPFCIGGFWEEKDEFVENSQDAFMMLTAPAKSDVNSYNEVMPWILPSDKAEDWLNPDLDLEQVREWHNAEDTLGFSIHAVSPAINNTEINDPRLLEANKPTDQHGNYTLFG